MQTKRLLKPIRGRICGQSIRTLLTLGAKSCIFDKTVPKMTALLRNAYRAIASAEASRPGTQAVERAMRLLKLMSLHGRQGMALGELSRRAGIDAATVRRILLGLMRGGFIAQDSVSRSYFIGLEFFSIAAAAANRFDLPETWRASLKRLSQKTGMPSAFFLRDSDDMVCIDLVHASGGAAAAEIGARRPIGSESFGVSLLAALSEEESEAVAIRNVRRYSRHPENAIRLVGERLRQARRDGYASEVDVFLPSWSLAVAVTDRRGRAEAAIGLCPSAEPPVSLAGPASIVIGEARTLQNQLWRLPDNGFPPAGGGLLHFVEAGVSHCETGSAV